MRTTIKDITTLQSSLSPRRLIPLCHTCPLFYSSRAKRLFLLSWRDGNEAGAVDQLRVGRCWTGSVRMWIYPSNNMGWQEVGTRRGSSGNALSDGVHKKDKQRKEGINTKWGIEEGRARSYLGHLIKDTREVCINSCLCLFSCKVLSAINCQVTCGLSDLPCLLCRRYIISEVFGGKITTWTRGWWADHVLQQLHLLLLKDESNLGLFSYVSLSCSFYRLDLNPFKWA